MLDNPPGCRVQSRLSWLHHVICRQSDARFFVEYIAGFSSHVRGVKVARYVTADLEGRRKAEFQGRARRIEKRLTHLKPSVGIL